MTNARATSDLLDSLHGLLSLTLQEQLLSYRMAKDEQGNQLPIPPAFLAQVMKFLKDNGIDSPHRAKKVLDTLNDAMPDFDDDYPQPGVPAH